MRARKIIGVLLALMLVFGMSSSVFADTATAPTPKISITADDTHSYDIYQIFTGDLKNNQLSNVCYGQNANLPDGKNIGDKVPTSAITDLASVNDSDLLVKIAKIMKYVNIGGTAFKEVKPENRSVEVPAGYYICVDKGTVGSGEEYNFYVVNVAGDMTIDVKRDSVESYKKVKDVNDSVANSTTDWQDSADYDIGDNVPFQLTADLTDKVATYKTYEVIFHDTLSAGLTYNDDAKVTMNNKDVTKSFKITHSNGALKISCSDVKALVAANGSVIKVDYTAKLNADAVVGAAGNLNTMYLEYSNNPNLDQNGNPSTSTGTTPEDKVKVFTYKAVVNKVDAADKTPLAGAGFTLYKANAEGKYVAVGEEQIADGKTVFEWKGLDDGNYRLEETTVPNGFRTMDPVEFTITAEHDFEGTDPLLTELNAGGKLTADKAAGTLTTTVENVYGSELPSTGGMGTTILYIVGGLLIVCAAGALVFRRRRTA